VASGGAGDADEDAVPLQRAGLSNMAAAAAAALSPNAAYHAAAAAAAGLPDEGGMAARRMSRARPSVARQSRMRANGDGGGGVAFNFRLPSRSRNSSHLSGGGGKHNARFGAYPKILLEDDEEEDEDAHFHNGRGSGSGIHNAARSGSYQNAGWADKTAASMDRVEMRMAAVDGRLAERSEQLLGLRYEQCTAAEIN
jgi:hypothetical protein